MPIRTCQDLELALARPFVMPAASLSLNPGPLGSKDQAISESSEIGLTDKFHTPVLSPPQFGVIIGHGF
jgi:hypothetical protein